MLRAEVLVMLACLSNVLVSFGNGDSPEDGAAEVSTTPDSMGKATEAAEATVSTVTQYTTSGNKVNLGTTSGQHLGYGEGYSAYYRNPLLGYYGTPSSSSVTDEIGGQLGSYGGYSQRSMMYGLPYSGMSRPPVGYYSPYNTWMTNRALGYGTPNLGRSYEPFHSHYSQSDSGINYKGADTFLAAARAGLGTQAGRTAHHVPATKHTNSRRFAIQDATVPEENFVITPKNKNIIKPTKIENDIQQHVNPTTPICEKTEPTKQSFKDTFLSFLGK